jgi:hypothetical protein
MIFEQKNYQNDWAGTGANGPVPDGTYYYIVRLYAPKINSSSDTFTGTLLVKR